MKICCEQRQAFLTECVNLIHEELRAQKGFSGLAMKSAYKTLQQIRPNMVERVLDHVLDEFIVELAEKKQAEHVAEAWLCIIDQKLDAYRSNPAALLYQTLRPQAHKNIVAAIPKITELIEKYELVTPARIELASAT